MVSPVPQRRLCGRATSQVRRYSRNRAGAGGLGGIHPHHLANGQRQPAVSYSEPLTDQALVRAQQVTIVGPTDR
jgi:hypothetical protein